MKLAALLFLAVAGTATFAYAEETTPATQPTTQQAAAVDAGNTKCPVEGEAVTKGNDVTYNGKIYHFCCDDCPAQFKKNPEKYIKKMNDNPEQYGLKKAS